MSHSAPCPVREKNTSSRVWLVIDMPDRGTPAVPTACITAAAVFAPLGQRHRDLAVGFCTGDAAGCRRPGVPRGKQVGQRGGVPLVVRGEEQFGRAEPVLEFLRGALGDHRAVVDDHDPVGEFVGFLEVLGGQHDRHPLPVEVPDHVPQFAPGCGVQAGGGFVEEQHLRHGHHRHGDVEAAAHAAGVGADQRSADIGQAQ
jgi:hypothetical protein